MACEGASHWQMALAIFMHLQRHLQLDQQNYHALISAFAQAITSKNSIRTAKNTVLDMVL